MREDVVVAPATPWGHAALAVVRLSGPGTAEVVARFVRPLSGGPLRVGRPRRVALFDADGTFDDGVIVLGASPRTYTGEDTAEITLHGNPLLVERALAAAVGAGARVARPGELTRRAVANGKLDLVQAEAVLQLTEATTARGVSIGRDALDGGLGALFTRLRGALVDAAAELEARLDYPDDELARVDDAALVAGLEAAAADCRALAATFAIGRVLVHGARVALVGSVNAGKSSLFNALLGRSRALVHETPGTTRDVLEVATTLHGVAVTLLDTAGERVTADPVEAAGLALARELVDDADLLVVVLRSRVGGPDATERAILARTAGRPRLVVLNGVDVPGAARVAGALPTVAITREGVDDLAKAIAGALVGDAPGNSRHLLASARQRDLLLAVADGVDEAVAALPVAGVAVSADAVTRAIAELDALTGAETREDVLDALFARFCIGK